MSKTLTLQKTDPLGSLRNLFLRADRLKTFRGGQGQLGWRTVDYYLIPVEDADAILKGDDK